MESAKRVWMGVKNIAMKKINRISHINLICKDLNKSASLFCNLFGADEVYSSDKKNFSLSKEKFFLIGDLWIALIFEDPIYLDKLSPFLSPTAQIIEYGCGYGRVIRTLKSAGYQNLIGFDFAPNMIKRGLSENPSLDLRL